MDPDVVFTLAGHLALVGWLLLILLPRRPVVVNLVAGAIVPGLLAAAYVTLVALFWRESAGGFSSLKEVAALFEHRWILLAGWIHYLAFDLLVGRWELLDAQARGIRHALVVPCLILTFLVGPAGWLVYLAVRLERFAAGTVKDPAAPVQASASILARGARSGGRRT